MPHRTEKVEHWKLIGKAPENPIAAVLPLASIILRQFSSDLFDKATKPFLRRPQRKCGEQELRDARSVW